MADIDSNIDKMNDLEIAFESPVSESLLNKVGANINALIDANDVQIFSSAGVFNYTTPENISQLLVLGAGAAGGAGGGATNLAAGSNVASGAGGGGVFLMSKNLFDITPSDTFIVSIGAGGAGGAGAPIGNNDGVIGADGVKSTFVSNSDSELRLEFNNIGLGGGPGLTAGDGGDPGIGALNTAYLFGGDGGFGGDRIPGQNQTAGSTNSEGNTAGAAGSDGTGATQGGGGGGAGWGANITGDGGDGDTNMDGGDGENGGGGGGGGGRLSSGSAAGTGGDGSDGIIIIVAIS